MTHAGTASSPALPKRRNVAMAVDSSSLCCYVTA
jgi:hypothetical protein